MRTAPRNITEYFNHDQIQARLKVADMMIEAGHYSEAHRLIVSMEGRGLLPHETALVLRPGNLRAYRAWRRMQSRPQSGLVN